MFGIFKSPLDAVAFNNIYASFFIRSVVEDGAFPSSRTLQNKIETYLPQLNAKLNPDQDKSIKLLDYLMPSQKESLVIMAKGAYQSLQKSDASGMSELINQFQRFMILDR